MNNPRVIHRSDYRHYDEECRRAERLVHGRMFFLSQSMAVTISIILFVAVLVGLVWLMHTALTRNDRFEDARIAEHSQMAEKVFGKK